MKLKQYLENLLNMVKENPLVLEYEVISSIDDEGNGYNTIYYSPTLGYYNEEDKEFYSKENIEEESEEYNGNIEINAICVN